MAVEAKNSTNRTDNAVTKFYRDIKAEVKKITWPSKDDIVKTTGVVIGTILIFTVVIWFFDSIFSVVLDYLLKLIS